MYHPEGRDSAETLKLKPAGKYFDASRSKALQPARKKLPWKSSFQCQIRSTLHFFINTMPLQRPAASNMPGSAPAATPTIPPFADCPRSQYATGHQDWYMISGPQQFPNFDLLRHIYQANHVCPLLLAIAAETRNHGDPMRFQQSVGTHRLGVAILSVCSRRISSWHDHCSPSSRRSVSK